MMNALRIFTTRYATFLIAAMLAACASTPTHEPPQVDRSASTEALKRLTRKRGELIDVTIYEFRSSVGEIPARGSTDMFKTANEEEAAFRHPTLHSLDTVVHHG